MTSAKTWTFGHLPLRSPCYPALPPNTVPLFLQCTLILQGGTFSPCNSLSGLRYRRTPSWGVPVQQTLSWTSVQNQFHGLPKTVVNFKALQFPGFSSSPFEDRQYNRPSQPSCAAAFFKGRRHPLVSILAFSHFISPQNSQMNTIRLWWFTALEFLKLLYNFLLRDFNLYKGHTLIFFAKCLWHRNFYTTLSSRHDARDSFNSSASLLRFSPDPLYTDSWGSLGCFGA